MVGSDIDVIRTRLKRMYARFTFSRFSWKVLRQPKYYRGLIIPTSAVLGYCLLKTGNKRLLYNEPLISANPLGDTYEMGLYINSQMELEKQKTIWRENRIRSHRSKFLRILHSIWFKINDSLLEPIKTFLRFVELSAIFIPVALTFPVAFIAGYKFDGSQIWYRFVKFALEWAGPSFIKLGQWGASRNDLFPKELCDELSSLHSDVRPHSITYTHEKIKDAFQVSNLDDIFEVFNENPIGVGAIAQVYTGRLSKQIVSERELDVRNDRWCAIKILHPNVSQKIKRDLKIMNFFANLINAIPTMEWLSLPVEVEQFSILMNLQLDLRIESLNYLKFRNNFDGYKQIRFPNVISKLCSRDILFEEYLIGFPMTDFLKTFDSQPENELTKKVSTPFVDAFLKMLILDDFVHADLHPGNVMIRFIKLNTFGTKTISDEMDMSKLVLNLKEKFENEDPDFISTMQTILQEYTPQICFIDAGLVTELNDKNRINFIELFNALARFNGYKAGELMVERSRTPETAINKSDFAHKVEELVNLVKQRTFTLGTVSIGDLLEKMLTMVRMHHVRMEGDFVSVVVAILLLEGIGRRLDPDLDLFESSLPILREFGLRREAGSLLKEADTLEMLKVWFGLEVRRLMNLSVKQTYELVKTDQLCPNY